jgi:ABC-type cobalamin transport system permease subunit
VITALLTLLVGFGLGFLAGAVREWDRGFEAGLDMRHLEIRERR